MKDYTINGNVLKQCYAAYCSKQDAKRDRAAKRAARWIRIKCWFLAKQGYSTKSFNLKSKSWSEAELIEDKLREAGLNVEADSTDSRKLYLSWY